MTYLGELMVGVPGGERWTSSMDERRLMVRDVSGEETSFPQLSQRTVGWGLDWNPAVGNISLIGDRRPEFPTSSFESILRRMFSQERLRECK